MYIKFLIISLIVIYTSIKLSDLTEWFELNTKLKGVMIGILLAFATSLPELVTSLTSLYIGQPELALAGILGSNMFNFVTLSVGFLIVYRLAPLSKIENNTNKLTFFLIVNYTIIGLLLYLTVYLDYSNSIFGVSYLFLFISGLYIYSIVSVNSGDTLSNSITIASRSEIIKKIVVAIFLAIFVIISSAFLSSTAETIMLKTNINASFAGALLIGASTSLPEVVATISLMKKQLFNIAVASIIGSNLFNFLVLAIVDISKRDNILISSSYDTSKLILLGFIASIVLYVVLRTTKASNKKMQFIAPISIILLYVLYLI